MIKAKLFQASTAAEVNAIPRIEERPEHIAIMKEIEPIQAKLSEIEERRKAAQIRRQREHKPKTASFLLAGGRVDVIDPTIEIAACYEEQHIVSGALTEKLEELQLIVGQLSFEESKKFVPEYLANLEKMSEALDILFQAQVSIHNIGKTLTDKGYQPVAEVLPHPRLMSLGDPKWNDSIAGQFTLFVQKYQDGQ